MNCEFCKNIFRNNSSLLNHQKTAKYCLKIQGVENKCTYTCDMCNSVFNLKSTLEKHQNRCVYNTPGIKKILEQNLLLRQQVISLQKDKLDLQESYEHIAEILAKRSTTTNNTVNNLNLGVFDKTQEDINRIVDENYNKDYLIDGQKGVARFTQLHVLKNEDSTKPPIYVITDRSRGNGKYKISDTEIVTDTGMLGLTKKIHPSIKRKANDIASEDNFANVEVFDGYQAVFNMGDDNGIFRKELIRILDLVS